MKYFLAALVLTLFAANSGVCQDPQVVYDFATRKATGMDSPTMQPRKNGSLVSLRIDNINTFRYKVSIKGIKVSNTTPIPKQLQALFELPDPSQSATEAAKGAAEANKAATDMNNLANSPVAAVAGNGLLKRELSTLVTLCNAFIAEAKKVTLLKFRRAELISLAKQNWINHAALRAQLPATLSSAAMQADIQNFMEAYRKAETQYDVALDAAPDGSDEKKRIEKALKTFEEGYDDINEKELLSFATDISALQSALSDPNYFIFISSPTQADDCDFIEFNTTIEPNQSEAFLPTGVPASFTVGVPVRGGWKADFSLGLNFSFGAGAKDEKYYLKPSSEGKGVLTKGENLNAVYPSISAMIHAYPRTGKSYAAGFMMGVGAGFKADNVLTAQYFLGGSLIFGKSQRFMINTGVSFLAVDRLKATYLADSKTEYSIESTKISDVTEKALKGSFFIGISYNITNRVETK